MSDTLKPTSRMGYPFKAKDGKPFADAQPVYEGLALAQGGHFPLGSNGHFHGGIHFDRATANVFAIDEGVQCLADGEIVAYRLDKKYPDATCAVEASAVESRNDKAALRPYSTGFVLVRHRLQAPAVPPPASKDETAQVISEQDYGTRLAARANGPTVGWIPAHARVALLDIRDGWVKVRILPPSTATWTNEPVDAPWLPIFSLDNVPVSLPNRWFSEGPLTATVLQRSPPKPTAQPSASASQSPRPAAPSLILYSLYMHLADGASYAATPNRPKPTWWPKKQYRVGQTPNKWTLQGKRIGGLMVRSAPASKPDNELGILVHGSVLEVEPIAGNDKWVTVKRIIEGGIATKPAGTQITSLDTTGFVFLKELDKFPGPASFDSIETPSPPIPISMGDLIGHMGEQVSSNEALIGKQPTTRPTLHLEVFSGEDVPQFLRDCRKHADKLAERHWTLLQLRKDDQIKGEPKDDAPVVVTMGSKWTIPVTRETPLKNDDKGQRWVNVKVHAADGSPAVGWAKDKDRRCTPWHWPDFEVVDAASNDAGTWWEGTAAAFVDYLRGGPRPPESPFFKQVRRSAGMDDDEKLDEKTLDAALRDRTASRRLGGLMAYHTSEWFVPSWASKYGVISEVAMELGKRAMENVGAEKHCVMRLQWWGDVAPAVGLPANGKVYHLHPAGLAAALRIEDVCHCGCCMGKVFYRVKYHAQYGPAYAGHMSLENYPHWDNLTESGQITQNEKAIIIAMSPNEGNLDSIQSYDSEILTAGAMQKTINSQGNGELHEQILKFKNRWPRRYTELFEECGWHISPSEISYKNLTGRHLKAEIRKDFSATSASGKKENALLGSILYAISSDEYIELQVMDFIDRLRLAISLIPSGHSYEIHHYLRSNIGRALVLDHHINRPNYVARDFGAALSRFYLSNPRAPKDPRTWGSNQQNYENAIISDYGVSREMTDATGRYNALEARI